MVEFVIITGLFSFSNTATFSITIMKKLKETSILLERVEILLALKIKH